MQCACAISSSVARLALPYFSTSHKWHVFRKNGIVHKIFFDFLYKFYLKYLSFWEEFSEILLKMCIGLHVKYPLFLSVINGLWILWTDFRKVAEPSSLMWTDGQTDMTKLFAILRTHVKSGPYSELVSHHFQTTCFPKINCNINLDLPYLSVSGWQSMKVLAGYKNCTQLTHPWWHMLCPSQLFKQLLLLSLSV